MANNTVQIEIKGLQELKNALDRYPRIAEPILQRAIDATGAIFAKNTLKGDPIPWRTGNLLMGFRFQSSRLESRWYPTANYAYLVHEGTSRQRANRFMPKIVDKARPEIDRVFESALDIITNELAK